MKQSALCAMLCAVVLPAAASAQVTAEPWFRAGTVMITLEAGGAAFTDFGRSRAQRAVADSEVFGRRVSAETSGSAGIDVTYWVRDAWGVRAGMSWIPTRFGVRNDAAGSRFLANMDPDGADPVYSTLRILNFSGSAVFRFPRALGRVVPYAMLGGALLDYRSGDDEPLPPEAWLAFAGGERQTGAVFLGIGAAIPLQKGSLLMTFELTNYIAPAPLGSVVPGTRFELVGVPMELVADRDGDVRYANHLRLVFGITRPFR